MKIWSLRAKLCAIALFGAYMLLFAGVVVDWFGSLADDPTFSYGLLVPLVSGWLAYGIMRRLGWPRLRAEVKPALAGYAVILGGVGLFCAGRLSTLLYLSRFASIVVLSGALLAILGWWVVARLCFPLAFLVFAIPLPTLIYLPLSALLQAASSALAGVMMDVLTVPALREGNVFILPQAQLDVVQACSGIHSLLALLAASTLSGYLLSRKLWKRVIVALSALPLAVLLNAVRIAALGLLSYRFSPAVADGFAHLTTGIVIFAVGSVLVLAFGAWVGGSESANDSCTDSISAQVSPMEIKQPARTGLNLAFALGLTGLAVILAHGNGPDRPVPLRRSLQEFPTNLSRWHGRDIVLPERILTNLRADDVLIREYTSADNAVPLTLYIAYYRRQRQEGAMHSPMHCIPGAGWEAQESGLLRVPYNGGDEPLVVNRVLFERNGRKLMVVYWYIEQSRIERSELQGAAQTLLHAILERRTDGCLVRLSAPVADDQQRTLKSILAFMDKAVPILLTDFMPPPVSSLMVASRRASLDNSSRRAP